MANPKVLIKTNFGDITVELDEKAAPKTVDNFLTYVLDGFFNGTIFHRVIPGFMIQGGGFTADFVQKPTRAPIKNEAANGLLNKKGTIAMARTSDVDSATAQFFINTADNAFLNHRRKTTDEFGYCVFGWVTEGMDVVGKIEKVATTQKGMHSDVPANPVIIESIEPV
jgi:cyclophilin family peptidyl-prolyl cis-trans isomerase